MRLVPGIKEGEINSHQWKTLFACFLGWLLDGMDIMLYSFALIPIREEFNLSNGQMGALATITLLTSVGGVFFGVLADKVGRVKALSYSILTYSLFTAMLATSQSLGQLILWRALIGLGLGGEWAAGAVLVSESWPAKHRGKAMGFVQSGWAIGYLLAAVLAALVLPRWGWRCLFALGIIPAFFTFWIRKNLGNPEHLPKTTAVRQSPSVIFKSLFSAQWRRYALLSSLLSTVVLFAYWGLFTWIPTYLASPVSKGGAGMSLLKSSAWVVPMQLGAFAGYLNFGYLSDRFGRRPSFAFFVFMASLVVFAYGRPGMSPTLLLVLGPLVGYFGHGYFSVFGTLLAELFPGEIRATAQSFCYNIGRSLSAFAPFTIGFLADRAGVGGALALTSFFFMLSAFLIYLFPETRAKELG